MATKSKRSATNKRTASATILSKKEHSSIRSLVSLAEEKDFSEIFTKYCAELRTLGIPNIKTVDNEPVPGEFPTVKYFLK